MRLLERCRLPRTVAIILLMLLAGFLILIVVLMVGPVVRLQLEGLAANLPRYLEQTQARLQPLIERLPAAGSLDLKNVLTEGMNRFGNLPGRILRAIPSLLSSSFSSVLNVLYLAINLLVIPISTFYFLRDFEVLKQRFMEYLPERFHASVVHLLTEIDEVLSNFMRGQLIVAALLAAIYSIGLVAIGTPMGLLIGLFAGVVSFIPYLGLILGLGPALLLTFLQFQDWQRPLAVLIVFAGAQFLEGNFITPRVVGQRVGLHPVAVMIAVLLGGNFFGLLGVLIAVPVAAVLRVVIDDWLLTPGGSAPGAPMLEDTGREDLAREEAE